VKLKKVIDLVMSLGRVRLVRRGCKLSESTGFFLRKSESTGWINRTKPFHLAMEYAWGWGWFWSNKRSL